MDDVDKLQALRGWVLTDNGSRAFQNRSAIRCYEQMGGFLLARLAEGRFRSVAELRGFARQLEGAVLSDIRHGAPEENGRAMLAFWTSALGFLTSLTPVDITDERDPARGES